jgi:hypothetical protein
MYNTGRVFHHNLEVCMQFTQQIKVRLGIILYAIGIALGLLLAISLTWADFEASSFELPTQNRILYGRAPEQEVENFSCPLAITRNETAAISAKINNPSERQLKTVLRMLQTSGSELVNLHESPLTFEPGQTFEFSWPVQASDAAWGYFIMARAVMLPSSPLPSMASYCGVLVLDFPFLTGNQVVGLLFLLAVILTAAGWKLWESNNTTQTVLAHEKNSRLMVGYAGLVILGVLLAAFSGWLMAALTFLLNFLLTLGLVTYKFLHS